MKSDGVECGALSLGIAREETSRIGKHSEPLTPRKEEKPREKKLRRERIKSSGNLKEEARREW